MAPEAPAVAVAFLDQAARANADFVDIGDLEARVVIAGPVGLDEAKHVVVAAAVSAAQERDDVLRAV
ncbi:hypothetical protein D3C83_301670 [compost metagenome]